MKITILGAAGVRTPLIVQAMVRRQERLGLDELALMDIDGERLALIGAVSAGRDGRAATAGPDGRPQARFTTHLTTDPAAALAGADFVITTFRVGGIESRVIDERVPLDYGILGQETTGPGGFAMGLRTIPVILDYVRLMQAVCPDAWLINFANPAGMLAEAVFSAGGWQRVVGICDAPHGMSRVAAALTGAASEQVYLDYFGLNHLGWVRGVLYRNQDHLPRFLELIRAAGGLPGLPFSPDFLAALGMIPNEYLFYYYYARQAVANILKAGTTRGERIAAANLRLYADLEMLNGRGDRDGMLKRYHAYLDERGQSYMAAETGHSQHLDPRNLGPLQELGPALEQALGGEGYAGVALDLIEALGGKCARTMIINIPNRGAIHGMEWGDVVEIPAMVERDLVRPLAVGKIPADCLGLMQQVKMYERLTIRAAVENTYLVAAQALALHPLVRDYDLARAILDGYIERHGAFFPRLD